MRESKATEALRALMGAALFTPVIAWIAYFYERTVGMTWLSKHQYVSHASTPAHLDSTFRMAAVSTAIGIAAAVGLFLVLRIRRSGR